MVTYCRFGQSKRQFFFLMKKIKRPLLVSSAIYLISLYLLSLIRSSFKLLAAALLFTALAVLIFLSSFIKRPVLTAIRFPACVIIIPVILSLIVSYASFDAYYERKSREFSGEHKITALILERTKDSSYYSEYNAYLLSTDGNKSEIRVKLTTDFISIYRAGDVIEAEADISPSCLDTSLSDRYELSKGYILRVECSDPTAISKVGSGSVFPYSYSAGIRSYISKMLTSMLDSRSAAFAKALACGDSSGLDSSLKAAFSAMGISHLLAISGLHLGAVMAMIGFILGKFGVSKRARDISVLVIGALYVFLLGAAPSVFRAYLMLAALIISDFSGRRRDSLTALFFSVALICTVSPFSIIDVGLHLSFFSTFGIISAALPALKKVHSAVNFRPARYVIDLEIVSISAQLFTLPYSIYYFGSFALISPITNLLFIPLVTLAVYILPLLLLSYFIPVVSIPIAAIFKALSSLIFILAEKLSAGLGGCSLLLTGRAAYYGGFIMIAVALLLVVIFKKAYAALLPASLYLVCILCILYLPVGRDAGSSYSVICRTNGSSDALIIKHGNSSAVLDNSYSGYSFMSSVMNGASDPRDGSVDTLIITHYHDYSMLNLMRIIEKYRVKCVIIALEDTDDSYSYAISEYAAERKVALIHLSSADTINFHGSEIRISDAGSLRDHRLIIAEITNGDEHISYLSRGVDPSEFENYGKTVIGSHGGRKPITVDPADLSDDICNIEDMLIVGKSK